MVTIIICALVVVFVGLYSEIRVHVMKLAIKKLIAKNLDLAYSVEALSEMASESVKDFDAIYDILTDHFNEQEIIELLGEKLKKIELEEGDY